MHLFTNLCVILVIDCSNLPISMSGEDFGKGCQGAIWKNSGSPSKWFCESKYGLYPWWGTCCEWENDKCIAKRKISFRQKFIQSIFDTINKKSNVA